MLCEDVDVVCVVIVCCQRGSQVREVGTCQSSQRLGSSLYTNPTEVVAQVHLYVLLMLYFVLKYYMHV